MISVLLLLLPRATITYPFYVLAIFYMFVFGYRECLKIILISAMLLLCFLATYSFYDLSIVAFLVELPLIIPLFCFCAGFTLKQLDYQAVIRFMSIALLCLSVMNMIVNYGFPFKLPYIHYLPDAYGAMFGLGGAKIVTVLGFFSIVAELYGRDSNRYFLCIAILNFLMPSYLLGVACGIVALGLVFIRSLKMVLICATVIGFVFSYVLYRLDNLDFSVYLDFGMLPKVYAYYSVFKMYIDEPLVALVGTGLGQYASTSALWASDYLSELSSHGIPDIPGFYMSEFHDTYLGTVLNLGVENFWAISSSFNKPYTSISTLYAETGVIITSWLIWKFTKRILSSTSENAPRIVLISFVGLIFAIDTWHDSPWFMLGLFLIIGMLNEKNTTNNTGAA